MRNFIAALSVLACLPAAAKVITLDCSYQNWKNQKELVWPVLISMDTESQLASATDTEAVKTGKLFSDGGSYWFTVYGSGMSFKYQINRQDLSLAVRYDFSGGINDIRTGKCSISTVGEPKI